MGSLDSETSMFNRSLDYSYPTATAAKGVYVHLSDGTKVLDGCCGAAVSCLGHGHPRIIKAMVDQAQKLAFVHTSFYTHEAQEGLADFLIQKSDGAFSKALFLSSGSEANETAFKLARQYHLSNGEPERIHFICRKDSYHGNTLGALSAGFNPARRKPFEAMVSPAFHHVSPCFYSADRQGMESEKAFLDRLLKEYEEMFQRLGPRKVAALVVEPVTGATIGTVVPVADYLTRLRKLCDKHGSLLLYDEVMCGMGRVGTYHAWQGLGGFPCAPDIQTIGKGLGSGYQPISGVLVSRKVHDTVRADNGGKSFVNGHTYQGHAMACAAALEVQRVIFEDNLLANVRKQGERLAQALKARLDPSIIKDIRGAGFFRTVEFKGASGPIAEEVRDVCFQKGLAVYLCGSQVDAILIAPPFIISPSEVDELVEIFVSAAHTVAGV